VLQTIFEVLRQVCRNTKDGKHSASLISAAKFTGCSLMTWSRDEAMEWHTLHSQLSFMLSNELPTEDIREGKRKADGNPLALAAKHQHKGKQQALRQAECIADVTRQRPQPSVAQELGMLTVLRQGTSAQALHQPTQPQCSAAR
jgi:hypothetical protein